MSEDALAAIQARVAGLLPIGYVVTALDPTYTHEQVDNLTQVLYTDAPALLAEVRRARELVAWGIEHIERHQAITRDLAYHPNQRGPDGQPARYLLARADAMSDTLEILRTIQNELVNPDPPPDSPYPPA